MKAHDEVAESSSIGEDRAAESRCSVCDAAVFDRWRANACRQSSRVLVYGVFGHFSDAAESVVHVVAVAFAVFSLWLSTRPAVPQFHYGYERITFFSAGFEGA